MSEVTFSLSSIPRRIHRPSSILLILVQMVFSPPPIYAVETLSLNDLIEKCRQDNPQIQAARQRYQAALARVRLLRTLADPQVTFEYDKITAGMDAVMRGKSSPMRTFAVSQEFPFPAKLFLRKQAAQKEADAYEQESLEVELKVLKNLKETFSRVFLIKKKILLTQDNLSTLSQFIEIANKKFAVNKARSQDILRAQVEHAKLSNQLILLEQEQGISHSLLNALLDLPGDTVLELREEGGGVSGDLNEREILKKTKEVRPELRSLRDWQKKAEVDYKLSKQEYGPDFMVQYRREEREGQVAAGAWSGMIGVTIPLWFFDKQTSQVKEAQAQWEVAKAEYRAGENMILFEVSSALAKVEAAQRLVKIYETGVLPQAEAALETAIAGYAADKIDFLDLLDASRSVRELQMEYFETLADREIAWADLARTAGYEMYP